MDNRDHDENIRYIEFPWETLPGRRALVAAEREERKQRERRYSEFPEPEFEGVPDVNLAGDLIKNDQRLNFMEKAKSLKEINKKLKAENRQLELKNEETKIQIEYLV